MPSKVLVIFHVYYVDQVPFFIDKMRNIHGVEWDLLVTGSTVTDQVRRSVLDFKPDAAFLETENVGYDVWPFICAVKSVDLSQYALIVKIHTKNMDENASIRFNGRNFNGPLWRDTMVDALLGNRENFTKVVKAFEDDRVGLAYSIDVNVRSRGTTIEDSSMLIDEMARIGIKPRSMEYCAGTMFAVRASAMSYLQRDDIDASMFPASGASHSNGTMAHVYERILSIAIGAQGYKKILLCNDLGRYVHLKIRTASQPLLEWIFSVNHFGDRGDKYLTIFGIKIKLS